VPIWPRICTTRRDELHSDGELMKILQWLLAGAVLGVIVAAFRDTENHVWLLPRAGAEDELTDEEPFLGYDGMDQETLLDWIDIADPDEYTIQRISRYEEVNQRRQPVLDALEEFLG
jgi:hypothetical protein